MLGGMDRSSQGHNSTTIFVLPPPSGRSPTAVTYMGYMNRGVATGNVGTFFLLITNKTNRQESGTASVLHFPRNQNDGRTDGRRTKERNRHTRRTRGEQP